MGVPISEPNTPPLEIVNVPPAMSSIAIEFVRACAPPTTRNGYAVSTRQTMNAAISHLVCQLGKRALHLREAERLDVSHDWHDEAVTSTHGISITRAQERHSTAERHSSRTHEATPRRR